MAAASAGGSPERIAAVAAWRETPYLAGAERAVLALTEAATRPAGRPDPVPDAVWDDAAAHHDDEELAGLLWSIAAINAGNRLDAATRQVAGARG